ncbi:hypothetical protein RRG08_039015 [Elysia crispata]|uniref:Uncharacterized protein n=1 Tax=Elysia crispata TaxID=231223 RepID=A0AAE1E4M8_9GAST|nr:hypothetical protein RRG08_039015 [Elysia crispata]
MKLKRKLTDAKAQATARRKKVAKLESLLCEAGEKIKHTPRRPRLEENMEGLAEVIYNIVVPEGAADERRRTETINTIKTLDDLKGALEERGYILSRSALYYRLIPANVRSIEQILTEDCFKEHSTNGEAVKPLVFISVDGGPDEAPQNTRTLVMWAATFKQLNLDACFIFSHAPGSSTYNPVERRMASLSKMTAGIILPFDSFGSHLNASNKTTDPVLEKKNFEAAGEILSQVFNEAEIDGYPVVSKFVSKVPSYGVTQATFLETFHYN